MLFTMHTSSFYLAACLTLSVLASPAPRSPGSDPATPDIDTSDPTLNSTIAPSSGGQSKSSSGKKLQATVTGYGECLSQGMACGLTGSPGKDPTAAMSACLIPTYGKGNCGTCWRITNPRTLNYHGKGQVPTVAGPLKSPKGDGMVVLINNSCSPGKDQYAPGALRQCAQNAQNPKDNLGSDTVLDLCSETDAVPNFFGSEKAGLAVADIEEVDCSEWSGTVRKVK